MTLHRDLIDDDVHTIISVIYSNAAARDADTAWQIATNVNKIVRVNSPAGYFALISAGPTIWKEMTVADQGLNTTDTPTFEGIQFNVGGSSPAYSEGLVFYDEVEGTLSYFGPEPDITMNIGEEQWIRVRNNTGSTILDGQVVYIDGAISENPTVALAKADNISTSGIIGVATHNIENTTVGFVTIFGHVHNIDTSSFAAGDSLYVSPTIEGELINIMPTGDNYSVIVGTVTRSHVSLGAILVHPQQVLPLSAGTFANLVGLNQPLKTTDDVIFGSLAVSSLNAAPASATATGTLGEIRWTATHVYLCVATDIWVRAALTTW